MPNPSPIPLLTLVKINNVASANHGRLSIVLKSRRFRSDSSRHAYLIAVIRDGQILEISTWYRESSLLTQGHDWTTARLQFVHAWIKSSPERSSLYLGELVARVKEQNWDPARPCIRWPKRVEISRGTSSVSGNTKRYQISNT